VGDLAGFPFWELDFDEKGAPVAGADELLEEVPAQKVTDLFVFSHGWNNDRKRALSLYERFFEQVRPLLDQAPPPGRSFGVAGIIWPSMRWIDEELPAEPGGGAAAFTTAAASDREVVESLKEVYPGESEQHALNQLADLLESRPEDEAALERFQELLGQLAGGPDAAESEEDNFEQGLVQDNPKKVFRQAARAAEDGRAGGGFDEGGAAVFDAGGAAGLGDEWDSIWEGAKQALRQTTYWEMKKRAGFVGKDGLGPLLSKLNARTPELRIHLVGHSFGARLVSFSLSGLDTSAGSPVKSLLLIQGAFSHYAFAESLPHDPKRSGALAGMAERVEGPIVVTHTAFDTAVGRFYPMGSLASGDDAAGVDEWMERWGAMGHDGAQAVDAADVPLGAVSTKYELAPGRFLNLGADDIIRHGHPPSGAHSDIFHPELAWACLAAAGAA
jgi:hypothetical protein